MRDFKGMKRQRGRNRGGGGSGGNKPTQNANRAFDSNGPDGVKVRGNAQHVFEKYQQLARDANAAGDRVLGENYLQHAEHYFRLIRAIQPNRPPSEIIGRDQFASGYDIDFEDESGQQALAVEEAAAAAAASEAASEARDDGDGQRDQNRNRDGRDRDGRDRDRNRNRDDRPRTEGDDRPRDDRPRDDRPRDERPRDDRPRDERPRDDDRPRFDRGDRRDRSRDRDDRPERDPLAVVQPTGDADDRGPMLRDSDGGASHAPAFLQASRSAPAPAAEDGEAKPKPRRRRAPRSFEGGEGAPATADSED